MLLGKIMKKIKDIFFIRISMKEFYKKWKRLVNSINSFDEKFYRDRNKSIVAVEN